MTPNQLLRYRAFRKAGNTAVLAKFRACGQCPAPTQMTWGRGSDGDKPRIIVENANGRLRVTACHDCESWRRGSSHHKGWYIDSMQSDTIHGVVIRLPHGRALVGYSDAWGSGTYILSPGIESAATDKEFTDLIYQADNMAEHAAEALRMHDEYWQALCKARADLRDVARDTREALQLMRDHKSLGTVTWYVCEAAQEAHDAYVAARNMALELADNARRYGVDWRECTP